MIQRIQSIYLFLVVVITVVLFFIPVATIDSGAGDTCDFNIVGMECPKTPVAEKLQLALPILNGITGLLSLITIFLFRKRLLQIRLSRIALLLNVILVGMIFFLADRAESALGEKALLHYGVGSFLPVINVILLLLAIRGITKDEALVRSADRIR